MTVSQEATPTFVSIAEAAATLGVHRDTIRRRIADGSLTGYRVSDRIIRLDLAEVTAIARPMNTAKRGGRDV